MRFSAFVKSVILSLVIFFIFLFVQAPAFAQTITPQTATQVQPYLAPATNPDVPNNLHTFSQGLMLEIMSSLSCNLSGKDLLSKNGQCLGFDPTTGKLGYLKNNGGALGAMSGMIAILYTPPLHTSDFIAYMGSNFGLAKPSYAQVTGIGFQGLTPLLHAWVVFRNVVYLLFVFIFILIGLAIMLRVRIDPRTVMTIQNQIPKIIISLVLVTFSFAIAGFLIDLMWVSIYVVINLMSQADPKITMSAVSTGIYNPAPVFANSLFSNDILGGIHSIAVNGAAAIADIVKNFIRPEVISPTTSGANSGGCSFGPACIITNPLGNLVGSASKGDIGGVLSSTASLTPVGIAANAIGSVVGAIPDVIGQAISTLISWVVGILAYLILIIALLWALLRLWFALLKAYIMILIDVIFAPFWIISGLIPGQQSAGFGAWLRDMAGNLAAFPAAIMMFLLAKLFSDSFITGASVTTNTAFIPPLLGQNASNYIASLIAIGVILATPGVVDMTKKAFKAPEIKFGPIAQAVGVGVGAPKRLGGGTIGVLTDPFRAQEEQGAAAAKRAGTGTGSTVGARVRSVFRSFK
jgi:hypothetical protein